MNVVFRNVVLDASEDRDGFYLEEISIGQFRSMDSDEEFKYPGRGNKMIRKVESANGGHV